MTEPMRAFTIFSQPSDAPGWAFVVRPFWITQTGVQPGPFACYCESLTQARSGLKGLTWIRRDKNDDPKIVESWL